MELKGARQSKTNLDVRNSVQTYNRQSQIRMSLILVDGGIKNNMYVESIPVEIETIEQKKKMRR